MANAGHCFRTDPEGLNPARSLILIFLPSGLPPLLFFPFLCCFAMSFPEPGFKPPRNWPWNLPLLLPANPRSLGLSGRAVCWDAAVGKPETGLAIGCRGQSTAVVI